MRFSLLFDVAAALWILVFAAVASADLAPPPGYVETCTVRRQQGAGEECVECGDAYHGDPEACARRLEEQGFAQRCRTSGASTWEEVWCRPRADGGSNSVSSARAVATGDARFAEPPPADSATTAAPVNNSEIHVAPPRGGCGSCAIQRSSRSRAGLIFVWLGVAVLSLHRRRREADPKP